MKLAELLNERADIRRKIASYRERLVQNAKVQEGDTFSEDPEELLKELNTSLKNYEELVKKINKTNSTTVFEGKTLTDMIAQRDVLQLGISIKREFLRSASEKIDRYSQKEVKILSTVDVSEKQKEIDRLSKKLRELDMKIQELNWTTEVF